MARKGAVGIEVKSPTVPQGVVLVAPFVPRIQQALIAFEPPVVKRVGPLARLVPAAREVHGQGTGRRVVASSPDPEDQVVPHRV